MGMFRVRRGFSLSQKLYSLLIPLAVAGLIASVITWRSLQSNPAGLIEAHQVRELATESLVLILTQDDATNTLDGAAKAPPPLLITVYTAPVTPFPASAKAKSGMPSPFRSATTTEVGATPAGMVTGVAKVPFPSPLRNASVPGVPPLITTRSILPSPSKSPAAIALMPETPAVDATADPKPVALPSRISTLEPDATARSEIPSPLKSAVRIV
jgi:hypothetical protein